MVLTPPGDTVIQSHIITDLGCFPNHHAHAVVNEETAADDGAGVDLDAGKKAVDLRQRSGMEFELVRP